MTSDVPSDLRRQVLERASGRCEYCHLPQVAALHRHEPDHIIPLQHGGKTDADNLALACLRCNRYKGPNIGSFDPRDGDLVRFFNPRIDKWYDHFDMDASGEIRPLTPEGRVTAFILRLNDPQRITERQQLIEVGLLP